MRIAKKYIYTAFFVLCCFIYIKNIYAYELGDQGASGYSGGITGSVSGSCSWNGWGTCSTLHADAFRFTLVDKNGNKVEGTRSVDFSSGNYNEYGINGLNFNGSSYSLINDDKYYYRFSDLTDSKKYNSKDDFWFVTIPSGPTYSNIENFVSSIILQEKKYVLKLDKKYDVDFFTLFLHLCGFLDDSYAGLDSFPQKKREMYEKNYYLILEPTYFVNYNTVQYGDLNSRKYGTVTELASRMKEGTDNYLTGLDLGLLSHVADFACFQHTPSNTTLSVIDKSVTCPHTYCSNCYSVSKSMLNNILDKSYGYGVRVISIKEFIDEPEGQEFDLNICSASTDTNGSDGLVSFGIYNGNILNFMKSESELKQSYFKVTDGVFCYDSVSYDFSNTISSLSKSRQQYTTLNIPSGIANVNRVCYVNNAYPYTAENVKNDISSYTDSNSNISLNLYGKKYDFSGALIGDIGDTTIYGGMDFFVHRYTFNIKYTVENSIKIGKDTVGSYDNSISFSNTQNLFGKSSKLVRNLLYTDKMPYILDINNEDRLVKEGATSHFTCDFKSVVEEAPAPNEGGENGSINFRTISLDNPFPARDGTARLPGINWLNKNNYVFDYITNNRGIRTVMNSDDVSPEAMYDNVEPMYTVVLDPSTMLAIRKYNKGRAYDDMLSGSLRDERCKDGRECFSTFLRNPDFIPVENLSGTCALANTGSISPRVIRYEFDKVLNNYSEEMYTLEKVRATVYGESVKFNPAYDFNNNHRNDTDDVEIFMNKDKNTQFYTCANKSYKSGGPTEGGSE